MPHPQAEFGLKRVSHSEKGTGGDGGEGMEVSEKIA